MKSSFFVSRLTIVFCLCYYAAVSDKVEMPDLLGHAVGEERFELLARLAGNEVNMFTLNFKLFLHYW